MAQKDMYQQRLEDAVTEAQKPLARHRDDEDLDRMLREQEREGDPMAAMLRRKKEKNTKTKGCSRFCHFLVNLMNLFCCYFVAVFSNELPPVLQRGRGTEALRRLPTASISYQAIAGMESTGTLLLHVYSDALVWIR